MNDWKVKDTDTGDVWHKDSRAEAEEAVEEFGDMRDLEIVRPDTASDGGESAASAEVVEDSGGTDANPPAPAAEDTDALDQLGESLDTDPLDVLPGYMITRVEGKPTLNKRGVSVLAYHFGIDVLEREVIAYPHEHDYETAVVEIMVEGEDGRRFSGIGEAHVDHTDKHQLLRMAETRAYKRAVIFATGTGIVGYNEIMESLE